ncbi:MAG: hypothetical protein CMK80_04895, partial [Pseudomonadales bacterium]|nr:hypothetical protein [Pseudomonadales bacterium]
KNAGLWMCLFALTSSLKPAFLFLSFPGFREEPYKWGWRRCWVYCRGSGHDMSWPYGGRW